MKNDHEVLRMRRERSHGKTQEQAMEVLFTLLAERYERRSVMLSTNLVFSEWTRIFKHR